LAYDLYYVQQLSPWLDLRLALATALYLLRVPFGVARQLLRIPSGETVERPSRNWLSLEERATAGAPRYETSALGDLDLSKMADKELEILAAVCRYDPAASELALRATASQTA
jgi:hypothetical protein